MANLHFIGGEKGGVGKSLLARVIAQYLIDRKIPFVGYDTDQSHGSFRRFYADFASPVLIDDFSSLDQVIEKLAEEPDKHALVDLAAQTLRHLKIWSDASAMSEILAENQHRAVFWHVMDDSLDSLATLGDVVEAFGPGASYVVVFNHGRGSTFAHVEDSPQLETAKNLGAQVVNLQRLHEASMRKIDQHSTSFWAAINRSDGPGALGLLERQRVKVWLRRTYQDLEPILAPA